MQSIAILGCGWFGLPLAKKLLAKGYCVKGTKTAEAGVNKLQKLGIEATKLDLNTTQSHQELLRLNDILNVDVLVVNIPPKLRSNNGNNNDYLQRLNVLKTLIGQRQYKKFIFISTTGVYPETGEFNEDEVAPWSVKSQILLAAETLFEQLNTCVVRFAGLIGENRNPARFLAGKTDLNGGQLPVNLVHLDDCICGVEAIIRAKHSQGIYNLVTPHHPSRCEFYTRASLNFNLIPPTFKESEFSSKTTNAIGKKVSGQRIVKELNYQYKYTDLFSLF